MRHIVIVQEVFIRIWEQKIIFKNKDRIKSYLYVAVRNRSLDYLKSTEYRKKKQLSAFELSILESDTYFEKEVLLEEVLSAVNKAVSKLPNKCRHVILLSLKGLKNEQISTELNVSLNTVKTQKKIAYKKLKSLLRDTSIFVLFIFN